MVHPESLDLIGNEPNEAYLINLKLTLMLAMSGGLCHVVQAAPATHSPAIRVLVARLRSRLPVGWVVSYDPDKHYLDILRSQSIEMEPEVFPNPPPDERSVPRLEPFELSLGVVPFVSPAAYRGHAQRNAAMEKELDLQLGVMTHEGIVAMHPPISFHPHTPEQRVQVAAYTREQAALLSLPDYHFQHLGLSWLWMRPDSCQRVVNPKIRAECEVVVQIVEGTVTRYDTSRSRG